MQYFIAGLALLSSAVSVSAQSINPGGPIQIVPTCTSTVFRSPPLQTDCSFSAHTKTVTSTQTGGCATSTRFLGVGLECRTVHTERGTTTVTSTVFAPSADVKRSTSAAPTCTTTVVEPAASQQNVANPTCTSYASTATVPSYVDCAGCALTTTQLRLGPGPVHRCTTTETLPVTTVTAPACSQTAAKKVKAKVA